MTDKPFTLIPW